MSKPIVLIDMDDTIVDFTGFFDALAAAGSPWDEARDGDRDGSPQVFAQASPVAGAVEAINALAADFDLHVLTASPWNNPLAPSQKLAWIKQHFGDGPDSAFYKRVTVSHQKHLFDGEFLVDDRPPKFGHFRGTWLHFRATDCEGDHPHPQSWQEVVAYLQAASATRS